MFTFRVRFAKVELLFCNFAVKQSYCFMKQVNKKLVRGCYDYLIIALAMVVGSLGWMVFLLPHKITIGGLPGISSVVFLGHRNTRSIHLFGYKRRLVGGSLESVRT